MLHTKWNKFLTTVFIFAQYLNLVSTPVYASNALKDSPKPKSGKRPEQVEIGRWAILCQRTTWTEGMDMCQNILKSRLATLVTIDEAKELINLIAGRSEPYTEEYDRKFKSVEFGMDRRYWIGLTDIVENGTWVWAQHPDGEKLDYDLWYPGQPDHINKTEHCVTLWNPAYYAGDKHTFNDENCNNLHYPICNNDR